MRSAESQVFVPAFSQPWNYTVGIFEVAPLPSLRLPPHHTAQPGILRTSLPPRCPSPQPASSHLPLRGLGLARRRLLLPPWGPSFCPDRLNRGGRRGRGKRELRPLQQGVCALRASARAHRSEKGGSAPQTRSLQPGPVGGQYMAGDGLCYIPP
ncbi:hypothetical protein P7K49_034378 [Saguinus oedipus]|uniref:Uncharacterized protein n=1 Tax=Saguinus oedipus TaxID=9490 RepID=A0ABQ9TUJ6_SAGOE|nr:hypothetical protein P7K49_034378 [Saguinus oedipus]